MFLPLCHVHTAIGLRKRHVHYYCGKQIEINQELSNMLCLINIMKGRLFRPTSFPGPFPWLGGGAPSQGKGPGNEVVFGPVHATPEEF